MKLNRVLAMFAILAVPAVAEDPVELTWKVAKGDRFKIEVSSEVKSVTEQDKEESTQEQTLSVTAVMEVVATDADGADVELKITSTRGKSKTHYSGEDPESTLLNSEAGDWAKPFKGRLTKAGELKLDLMDLVMNTEILLNNALVQAFPVLPGKPVKKNETWPGAGGMGEETLRVAEVRTKAGKQEAALTGEVKGDKKTPAAGGNPARTEKAGGTVKAVFDATSGNLKSSEMRVTSEFHDTDGRKKIADNVTTFTRTVTVTRLEEGK